MGLLQFLEKEEKARKIFGKRELKIIEKQLWGVNLTQSEKNRLSRDIRKKLEFIGEVTKFSDEFALKKGKEIKKLVKETKDLILKTKWFKKIKSIILFGSSVENKRTLKSDIDLAIEFDEINLKDATLFRKEIFGKVSSNKMDIQVYNILPIKIRREIDKNGKFVYERKN